MNVDRCVACNRVIPEGVSVCPQCEAGEIHNLPSAETTIVIDNINKVKEFSALCAKCDGDVAVYSGRYIVSGKSMMALFSLDLTKPMKVEFCGHIPKEVKDGMKKFIVN